MKTYVSFLPGTLCSVPEEWGGGEGVKTSKGAIFTFGFESNPLLPGLINRLSRDYRESGVVLAMHPIGRRSEILAADNFFFISGNNIERWFSLIPQTETSWPWPGGSFHALRNGKGNESKLFLEWTDSANPRIGNTSY